MTIQNFLAASLIFVGSIAGAQTSDTTSSSNSANANPSSNALGDFTDFGSTNPDATGNFSQGQGPIFPDAFNMSPTNGVRNSLTAPLDTTTHFDSSTVPPTAQTSPFASPSLNTNSDSLSTSSQTDTLQQNSSTSSATTSAPFETATPIQQTIPVNPSATGPANSSGTSSINPPVSQ